MGISETELQLHSATIVGDFIKVDYSLIDDNGIANIQQDISLWRVSEFVNDGELNVAEFVNSSLDIDRIYFDNATWVADNVFRMTELYLEDQLCSA